MENIIKPMTKEYLKNYPKNRELYRVVNVICNGVINKVSGRLYRCSDYCVETAFKYSIPFEEEWVYTTLRNFIYQSEMQLSILEFHNLQLKLTNDANERVKIREQFIQDLLAELQVVFPDSKISWIEKSHFPHGHNYHEVKKMFIEIDWTPSPPPL
jgi:hypothetical protein